MKAIGNNNNLVYVDINYEQLSKNISFKEEKKNFFGQIKIEEGFYFLDYIISDKLPNTVFLKDDNTVYDKPYINLEYNNGRVHTIYFESDKEMILYIKREFQSSNWKYLE